jgi:hypothetical protein
VVSPFLPEKDRELKAVLLIQTGIRPGPITMPASPIFNTEAAMRGAVYELKAQLLTAILFTLLPVLWPLILVIIGISLIQIFFVRLSERLSHHE